MKAFIGFSSGQDGVLALYKTLTETDYDVYAINIQHKKIYAKNDIKYNEQYRIDIINWLKENCRDFVYDSIVGPVAYWSPHWQGDKDYSEVSEEKVNEWKNKYKTEYWISVLEQWYAYTKVAQKLECDTIIAGNDIVQNISISGISGVELVNMISEIDVSFPLRSLGRIGIYHLLPEELKERIAPCDDFKSMRTSGPCGRCRKCLTRRIYDNLYMTEKYTIEELDKIYYNSYVNTRIKESATGDGMAGLSRLLE